MENTMLIELTNQKAIGLLRELEDLNLIRVIREDTDQKKTGLSSKYRGMISKKEGEDLNNHIGKMRSEWNDM